MGFKGVINNYSSTRRPGHNITHAKFQILICFRLDFVTIMMFQQPLKIEGFVEQLLTERRKVINRGSKSSFLSLVSFQLKTNDCV